MRDMRAPCFKKIKGESIFLYGKEEHYFVLCVCIDCTHNSPMVLVWFFYLEEWKKEDFHPF